jgi:hypothetical protein
MHENRETSESSARESGADRLVKTKGCTTSVNETEESDCAIVPMNQPNKGGVPKGSPTAEAGEGRAWTKENSNLIHTIPTLCGLFVVSQELIGMRQVSLALFIRGRSRMRYVASGFTWRPVNNLSREQECLKLNAT